MVKLTCLILLCALSALSQPPGTNDLYNVFCSDCGVWSQAKPFKIDHFGSSVSTNSNEMIQEYGVWFYCAHCTNQFAVSESVITQKNQALRIKPLPVPPMPTMTRIEDPFMLAHVDPGWQVQYWTFDKVRMSEMQSWMTNMDNVRVVVLVPPPK